MKSWIVFRTIAIACCLVSLTSAQETEQAGQTKLKPVFNDDFSTDTRGDYEINGDVAWEPGTLTVSEGTSIKRAINGGPWAKIELDFGKDGWGSGNESQELRIWLLLDGATNCFVQLTMPSDDKHAGAVALVDTGIENGQAIAQVVRVKSLARSIPRHLVVEYQQGLVTVVVDHVAVLSAYIDNGAAVLHDSALRAATGFLGLDEWKVSSEPAASTLSEKQLRQVAEANAAEEKLLKLYQSGKFAEAAEVGRSVLQLRLSIYGDQHLDYAKALNDLGSMYQLMGDFTRALPLQLEAFSIRRRILGRKHPVLATTLNNLASLYQLMGRYAQAETLHLQARDIRLETLGKEHPEYAQCLNNLGSMYRSMGEYNKALLLLLEARDIRKQSLDERHPDYVLSLSALASLYFSMGEHVRAERLMLKCCDLRKEILGEEHPSYAKSLNDLATLYVSMGEYPMAESLFVQACGIWGQVPGVEHPDYVTGLNNMAGLLYAMGEYARAEPLYLQACEVRKKVLGEEHADYATGLNSLAAVYFAVGKIDLAERLYTQACDIRKATLGDGHPEYATSLNNLATLYKAVGAYNQAEPLYMKARDIWQNILGKAHPNYAQVVHSSALLSSFMKDTTSAESMHLDAWSAQRNAAERALSSFSEARARSWFVKKRPRTDLVLHILRGQEKWGSRKAYETVWATKGMIDRLRIGQTLSSGASAEARRVFTELRDARLKLAKLVSATPSPAQAEGYRRALVVASSRKETLEKRLGTLSIATARELAIRDAKFEDLSQQLPEGVAMVDFVQLPDWEPVEQEITIKLGNGTTETRTVKKEKARPVYDAFVLRADRSKTGNPAKWIPLGSAEPIESAIASWRTKFALADDGEAGSKATLADPEQMLRKLIWNKLEPHLDGIHTVVLIPDGALHRLPWAALPGRNEGEYLIHDYALSTASSGQRLYGALTEPKIAKSPELLVVGGIEYDKRPTQSSVNGGPTLIASAGRPIMRSKDDFGWGYLEGTEKEATDIARLWGDRGAVRELRGVQADEHSLARLLPQSRFAHLATHGFFDTSGEIYGTNLREQSLFETSTINAQRQSSVAYRNPLLMTGIVMAGANVPPEKDDYGLPVGDDGILTAEEISGLDLRNTELVTLSACETGLGDVAAGEGVYGLTRVLHKSGVRSVVASQWKVSDVATQELMRRFYENLWVKKQSKVEALRSAQLWMLEHPKELQAMGIDDVTTRAKPRDLKQQTERPQTSVSNRTAPFFWAAFQLSGDWR